MNEIIGMLESLKEDHEQIIITDELIKDYIEENIELLVNEIREQL
jgi:hypothetical protein